MWENIITELIATGLSEREIAERVGVKQPTINRLKLGRRKRLDHAVGEQLLALHKQIVGQVPA